MQVRQWFQCLSSSSSLMRLNSPDSLNSLRSTNMPSSCLGPLWALNLGVAIAHERLDALK